MIFSLPLSLCLSEQTIEQNNVNGPVSSNQAPLTGPLAVTGFPTPRLVVCPKCALNSHYCGQLCEISLRYIVSLCVQFLSVVMMDTIIPQCNT